MEKLLEVLVGQLPEAIYFALFLLFTKEIKYRKFQFILLVVLEYLLSFQAIRYSLWSHITFFIGVYLILKLLYKERAQITDIFTMSIASILIIIVSIILYFPMLWLSGNYALYVILGRVCLYSIIILNRKRLPRIQKIYKKMWNRSNTPKPMKSATFRVLNTVILNIMFVVLNSGMLMSLIIF